MLNGLDLNLVIAILFGIFVIYLLAKLLWPPVQFILKFLIRMLIGVVILVAFNYLGAIWGLSIGVNPVTGFTVGLLGVHGLLLLAVLAYLL